MKKTLAEKAYDDFRYCEWFQKLESRLTAFWPTTWNKLEVAVTKALENGLDIKTLSAVLGHSSVEMINELKNEAIAQ